ncbi:hypothetical protein [Parvularcula maris]|uniref:Uncharacterized protein n=1 Tax=Parvularcula maris TaxID=2965077 RepID=A0A9X2L862_9PROT|nr:hypothetical protein [Parvularcula maris]MCQ8183922.1 hypothetical protein [Parvularcula maris]
MTLIDRRCGVNGFLLGALTFAVTLTVIAIDLAFAGSTVWKTAELAAGPVHSALTSLASLLLTWFRGQDDAVLLIETYRDTKLMPATVTFLLVTAVIRLLVSAVLTLAFRR